MIALYQYKLLIRGSACQCQMTQARTCMPLSLQTDLRQCTNANSAEAQDDATAADSMAQPHIEPPFPTCGFCPLVMKDALHMPVFA